MIAVLLEKFDDAAREGEPAVEALAAAFRGGGEHVRYKAMSALGNTKSAEAIQPILGAVKDGYDPRSAASVLSYIGDSAVLPLITELERPSAGNRTRHVREAVVGALGLLRDSRAVEPLIRSLEANNLLTPEMEIIAALGEIGDPRAEPYVRKRLHRGDVAVRALKKVRSSIDTSSDPELALAEGDLKSLRAIGASAAEILLKGLSREDSSTRLCAQLLGEIRDRRAVPALIYLLKKGGGGGDWGFQKVAAEALSNIGDQAAIRPMIEVLTSDTYAFELRFCLRDGILKLLQENLGQVPTETLKMVAALSGGITVQHNVGLGAREVVAFDDAVGIACRELADRARLHSNPDETGH